MNPTFSPAKLKEMLPILKMTSDRLIVTIDKNLDSEMNFTEYVGRMTMDAVFNCLFGVEVDLQNDLDNIYLIKTRSQIDMASDLSPLFNFLSRRILLGL
jgi:cytochrome P450